MENPNVLNLNQSDKLFWHGYIEFYERFFINRKIETIAEIGVFKGESIKWLLHRFPTAKIYGADILPYSDLWPKDERFIFTQIDQGDQCLLKKFYSQAQFDLIIEDGSHDPFHQIIALIHGITKINSGGLYILEDIHTSHPSYESKKLNGTDVGCSSGNLNALSALLAIQHYKRLGIAIDLQIAKDIEKGPLISSKEIVLLDSKISNISLFRRAHLPDRCFNCGNIHFKYNKLKCNCGVEIFSDSDSMSFVLEVK